MASCLLFAWRKLHDRKRPFGTSIREAELQATTVSRVLIDACKLSTACFTMQVPLQCLVGQEDKNLVTVVN
jgi:hypothetical protein